ncbi:MAG: 2-oxo acid dehydrogenase subunit E2 [Planctomycetota bacterium]
MSTTVPPPFDFEELFGVNAGFVEQVYAEFMARPDSVSDEWQRFFERHLPAEHLPERPAEPVATTKDASGGAADSTEVPAGAKPLSGIAAKIAQNMAESLTVPTATSARDVPVRVLEENRKIVNEHLIGEVRGKASFTHFIAWAMVRAMIDVQGMQARYVVYGEKAHREVSDSINVGIAVDVSKPGGPRQLLVPNIKDCASMNFATFLAAYDAQVRKARKGKLTPQDFQGTTCSLTNPGTIGTLSSLPRLMTGQSFILATGAIAYPAAYIRSKINRHICVSLA